MLINVAFVAITSNFGGCVKRVMLAENGVELFEGPKTDH